MSVGLTVGISLLIFVVLLASELPVALALAAAGTAGLLMTEDVAQTAATLASAAYQASSTYTLVVIPMFILMGVLVANAGVLGDLFSLANRVTRRIPGGLGIATVLSAAGFAAVTGSSAAAVATLGRLCVTEMRRHGYALKLAAGIVAASGTLGILIPPSVVLVIYGVITTESVGQLLLAAIVPGVITALAYVATIVLLATVGSGGARPSALDEGAATIPAAPPLGSGPRVSRRRQLLREYEAVFYIAVVFVVVLGGIYSGVFTETEAGAVGALVALVILVVRSRRTERGLLRSFGSALRETSSVTSMIFALLIGGSIFTLFLVTARVPNTLTDWIVGLGLNGLLIVVLILLVLLVLGALLDGVSILLLTIPLAYPVITELGYSGLWFGILAVKMIEVGLLTPPFGLNVYLVAGVVKEVRVEDAFRGVAPFVLAELVVVALLVGFPGLVTWLPGLVAN